MDRKPDNPLVWAWYWIRTLRPWRIYDKYDYLTRTPRLMGLAYSIPERLQIVVCLVPFNWPVALFVRFYWWMRYNPLAPEKKGTQDARS